MLGLFSLEKRRLYNCLSVPCESVEGHRGRAEENGH